MHGQAHTGPVTYLDRVGAVDLFHVVDVVPGGDREADRLGQQVHQFDHVGLCHRQQALGGVDAGRQGDDGGPDPVSVVVRGPLDGAKVFERPEKSGDGAGRKVDPPGQVGDAPGLVGQLVQ